MTKKVILSILLLIFLFIGGFFLLRYLNYLGDDDPYKTFILPRVEMSVIEVTSLDLDKTEMLAKVLIDNPMPIAFGADSIRYTLFISDVKVIESTYRKSVKIAASDSSWIVMPVTVFTKDLAAVLEDAEKRGIDSVEYHLVATFHTDLIIKKDFEIDKTILYPPIYIPKIEITHVDMDSLKFSGAAFEITTTIVNKNKFPLKANSIAYSFSIADEEWANGNIDDPLNIPAQGSAPVNIHLRLSFKEIGQTVWGALTAKDSTDYDLTMALKLEAKNNMLDNSKFILHSGGSVRSLLAQTKRSPEEKKEAREKKKEKKKEKAEAEQ